MRIFLTVALCAVAAPAFAQSFEVEPYLQLVETESAWVLWETDSDAASVVRFGLTEALGQTAEGSRADVPGGGWVHEVELDGLEPFTRYYYRVESGAAVSEIAHFVTAPTADSETSFRFVAMSDMQRDSSNPAIFDDLVRDGVIAVFEDRYDVDLTDSLAMTLIPGDLVENGNQRGDWHDEFWDAVAPLASQVPVYAVPGNHENNAAAFFEYFHQPGNGSPGFDEHWWWLDYSNVRLIGLDSNSLYANPIQLDWLQAVLEETCEAEHIDFVFAQLHHPHRSELWTPGELPFTGEVIARLESFSADCGKPSAHLFGHTHGYSRGQSRDHDHLWINVASAGGRIDRWGEYPQEDYDEFTVSRDEYGFVIFEVVAGDDPAFTLERINRGLPEAPVDNEVVDVVHVRRFNEPPVRPVIGVPTGEANPDCSVLVASEFIDRDGDELGAAHWQIAESCEGFDEPIVDSWRQHQNLYFGVDDQADDDLTDEEVRSLPPSSELCARVRYRDRSLAWSAWSEPAGFRTGDTGAGDNLLSNGGAEAGMEDWTVSEGIVESLPAEECDGTRPYAGERYFVAGGLCESAAYGEAFQRVELGLDWIGRTLEYGGYLRDWNGADVPAVWLEFVGLADVPIRESERLERAAATWDVVRGTVEVPAGTVAVNFYMSGTRTAGNDNDSYLDELWVRQAADEIECSVPERPEPGEPEPDVGPEPEPDVGPDGGSDVGPDAGPDAVDAADVPDTQDDTPEGDADSETGEDAAGDSGPDLRDDSSPDSAPDGSLEDTVESDSGEDEDGELSVSGGGGGCVQAAPARSPWWPAVLLALVFRRRTARDGS